jgi:hypothetical protein
VSYENPEDIPSGMRKVHRRLESWRKRRRGRMPIPKPLWAAAGAVAREHGVFRTSKVLRLEFNKLKEFAERVKPRKRATTPPAQFVELMTTSAAGVSECVIEMEGRHGKMRIEWKGMTAADLAQLSRMMMEQT